jgi:hypothetical protein
MAVVFVFTEGEEIRAKDVGVNYIKLNDETEESLIKFINDPFTLIFMPFLSKEDERKELIINFHNQIVMRKIWRGK